MNIKRERLSESYKGWKKGDTVRLRDNPKAGTARINYFYKDIDGGVILSRPLNRFKSWNVDDLEKVKL